MALSYVFVAIGLAFLVFLAIAGILPLPATSILLYTVASVITAWFSFGASLGGETPSSMILASYRKKDGQTEQELQQLFTARGLIGKRIDDLVSFGYVIKRKNRLIITQKGKIVFWCMRVYQQLFFRKENG